MTLINGAKTLLLLNEKPKAGFELPDIKAALYNVLLGNVRIVGNVSDIRFCLETFGMGELKHFFRLEIFSITNKGRDWLRKHGLI